ncbi:response regulator [Brevundimonas sp. FT23028]|uniref:response regulator n=1 Tax=Brevundimonas sp. FT23028 TaxID=3393748 RepID=UPI003B5893F4
MSDAPRSIAILEDDPNVARHFREIVEGVPDLGLVGMADCLADAPALLDFGPDLFLTDIGLPDGSGLTFIPGIKARLPECRVLVITAFGDRDTVVSALNAGADGYLLKDSSTAVILDGIRATLDGGAPISPSAAVYLLERLRAPEAEAAPDLSTDERLTPREVELLELFARGQSYKAAGRALGISPLTVGNHVKSIYRKLQVHSRGEAVYEAVRRRQLSL